MITDTVGQNRQTPARVAPLMNVVSGITQIHPLTLAATPLGVVTECRRIRARLLGDP